MTKYMTCTGCAVEKSTCERRREIQEAIKGVGLTSFKHTCADRKPVFSTGERVSFSWVFFEHGRHPGGGYDQDEHTFHATVVQEVKGGNRYVVKVDEGPSQEYDSEPINAEDFFKNDRLIIKVWRARMKSLCSFVSMCPVCAETEVGDMCYQSEYAPKIDGCLKNS